MRTSQSCRDQREIQACAGLYIISFIGDKYFVTWGHSKTSGNPKDSLGHMEEHGYRAVQRWPYPSWYVPSLFSTFVKVSGHLWRQRIAVKIHTTLWWFCLLDKTLVGAFYKTVIMIVMIQDGWSHVNPYTAHKFKSFRISLKISKPGGTRYSLVPKQAMGNIPSLLKNHLFLKFYHLLNEITV